MNTNWLGKNMVIHTRVHHPQPVCMLDIAFAIVIFPGTSLIITYSIAHANVDPCFLSVLHEVMGYRALKLIINEHFLLL